MSSAGRGYLGGVEARDPISGGHKVTEESLSDFARRHGWEVKENKGADDYLSEAWYSKDDDRVRVMLWDRSVTAALVNRIAVPFDVRSRVEKYLAGVACTGCTYDPHPLASYDSMSHKTCPIHGLEEAVNG